MRVSVLTISDSVAAGKAEDRSGPSLMARCGELGWEIASFAVCADDRPAIEAFLRGAADSNSADLILTTGGTGVGPRDVTPEATAAVCERLIPGFSQQMRNAGREKNAAGNSFARCRRHSRAGDHHQSAGQPARRRGISRYDCRPAAARCGRATRRTPRLVRATPPNAL